MRRRDVFFEPCAVIFEYEDPGSSGSMDIMYAPRCGCGAHYYGADEFFEIQGDEGFLWVTRCTGEMLDLPAVVLYDGEAGQQTTTSFPHVDADWGDGLPAGVAALRRRHGRRHAGRDERRPTPSRPSSSASPSTRRATPASRSTRAPSPGRWFPRAGPVTDRTWGVDGRGPTMKVTRTLHHSVNVEGELAETVEFYQRLLGMPDDHRPTIPGIDGHWFGSRSGPAPSGRRAGRSRTHPTDRAPRVLRGHRPGGGHRRARRAGIPYVEGAQGTTVQIWFTDPAGNTVEIQQDTGE